MKSKITLLFIFLMFTIKYGNAQAPNSNMGGGEFVFNSNNEPCVTPEQRENMKQEIMKSISNLKVNNKLFNSKNKTEDHPLFIWPIKKANTVDYNEVYSVFNYVDHNTAFPNQVTDYNCGTRTYDTSGGYNHEGTDIVTWPFRWKLMDDDGVEVIAAAPGQIIVKHDGEFDRSCDFNTTTPWNVIIIQHSDGSVAAYGHMKNGSLTSKNVGDMVSVGEYLGIVGSSGISNFPHLHFEVLTDETFTQVVDPYSGICNATTTESWWAEERPYNSPGINAVLTHTADPIFPECPTAEITNESNEFEVNQEVFFVVYLKDQVAGTSLNLRIIKPDNTDLFNWTHNLTDTFYASWWRWNAYPDVAGEWKWEATYAGETVTHTFNVGTLSVNNEVLKETVIHPNPTHNLIYIDTVKKIINADVINVTGKTIQSFNNFSEGLKTIDTSKLSNGLYFLRLESEAREKKTIKFIKQ